MLRATEPHGRITTHWHPVAAGFYFEDTAGKGMLIQMETLGLTRIGLFEYSSEPVFDAFEFKVASWGNSSRGGSYHGLCRFTREDVIGPVGFATSCGIINDTFHDFKLIVKQGMFEYYQDDLLVQTYITGPASGRFALFAKSGLIEFRNLKVYSLTLGSLSQ